LLPQRCSASWGQFPRLEPPRSPSRSPSGQSRPVTMTVRMAPRRRSMKPMPTRSGRRRESISCSCRRFNGGAARSAPMTSMSTTAPDCSMPAQRYWAT